MNNVIHVDFSKVNARESLLQEVFGFDPDLTAYLNSLRCMGVEEDDVLDTLDAIQNMDLYFAADNEIQEFANGWLHKFL